MTGRKTSPQPEQITKRNRTAPRYRNRFIQTPGYWIARNGYCSGNVVDWGNGWALSVVSYQFFYHFFGVPRWPLVGTWRTGYGVGGSGGRDCGLGMRGRRR